MIKNPGASQTLDPSTRSLVTVVGLHDKRLTDAELNLIQSLQDSKRERILADQTCSGALTWQPFAFTARTLVDQPLTFTVPAFDVLMNGEVVTIGGNLSGLLAQNNVVLPAPSFWSPGSSSSPCSLYVAFLEFWYQRLDPTTGQGYAQDPLTKVLYFYPNGCVNATQSNLIANDTINPFQSVKTTERVQLQWAIRVQPIDPTYDFTQYSFGLDPGLTAAQAVYGQASQSSPSNSTLFQFTNMGPINGDAGLWRSGDGNYLNELGSLDGYSYAMPLAVILQRNTGPYDPAQNPFGTANPNVSGSWAVRTGSCGRFDGKYADVVFPDDVVDTRSIISLGGWNEPELMRRGFVDVISGKTRLALTRGEIPGGSSLAVGSTLDYTITVAPSEMPGTDTIGAFDGFRNGFSSADYTSYVTQSVTVDAKTTGILGARWQQGDSFVVSLPGSTPATIGYIRVQGLVSDSVSGTQTPVMFLSGQISIVGLGSKKVTVTFIKNLTGTTYDPGANPMYVTLGVEYPANSGMDLVKIPTQVAGGSLVDSVSGQTIPVYGVSSYAVQANLLSTVSGTAWAINPSYSNVIFGTRVQVPIPGSQGSTAIDSNGNTITTFTLSLTGLTAGLNGVYVISAANQSTGAAYSILSRSVSGTNFTFSFQVQGPVSSTDTVMAVVLASNTAQLSYTAPIKAVTAIEQTVIAGNANGLSFSPDPRVSIVSVANYPGDHNELVLATTGGTLTGIAGDDSSKLIWVANTSGIYMAVKVSSVTLSGGFAILNVPASVNLEAQRFFVVAALLPAFAPATTLTLIESYIPYQGEGRTSRDYEIIQTENAALVTTNGTGTAPVPGLRDVYPYNRELPVSVTLPAQVGWTDSTLLNQPVASYFDTNFDCKAFENVEHTFEVPVHSNDFIEPVGSDKLKSFQLESEGARGFSKAIPHMGFAIRPVTPKTALGTDVTATSNAVTLYVNNAIGSDSNDGLTPSTPLLTIKAAIASLPSVLRHPCSIQLMPTGVPYTPTVSNMQVVALGDGVVRSAKYYALGNISFVIQASGRLVITALAGTTGAVTIDATGFAGYGDGPTSAFFIDNSRVLFNQIEFKGFQNPAVKGLNANVEFISCAFTTNNQAASFEQGSTVVLDQSTITLGGAGNGFVLSQSELDATAVTLIVQAGTAPGMFYEVGNGSGLTLAGHSPAQETNITAATIVAKALRNSSITTSSDFSTQGQALLIQNSVLSRTVSVNPFIGGVATDSSSSQSTAL